MRRAEYIRSTKLNRYCLVELRLPGLSHSTSMFRSDATGLSKA